MDFSSKEAMEAFQEIMVAFKAEGRLKRSEEAEERLLEALTLRLVQQHHSATLPGVGTRAKKKPSRASRQKGALVAEELAEA